MSDTSMGGTDHIITARATVHRYGTFDTPDDLPKDDKPSLMTFSAGEHVAHVGYECTCGERFIFGRTAAEHLRQQDTDT